MIWSREHVSSLGRTVKVDKLSNELNVNTDLLRRSLLEPLIFCSNDIKGIIGRPNLKMTNRYKADIYIIETIKQNAYCTFDAGSHAICLMSGLIFASYALSNVLFNCKDFLEYIGNTADFRESGRYPSVLDAMREAAKLSWDEQSSIENIKKLKPPCSVRARHAETMYKYIMKFICLHEIGHSLLGHCHFVNNIMGSNALEDGREKIIQTEKNWNIMQTLEYEADYDAFWFMFKEFHVSHRDKEIDSGTIEDTKIFILSVLLAIWMLSSEYELTTIEGNPAETHPNPAYRATQIYNHMITMAAIDKHVASVTPELIDDILGMTSCDPSLFTVSFPLMPVALDEFLKAVNNSISQNLDALSKLGDFRYINPELQIGYDGMKNSELYINGRLIQNPKS